MKKLVYVFVVVCILFMANGVFAADNISVLLDGRGLSFDVPPQTISGRTMLPFRAIFEALGASVEWDEANQTAIGVKEGKKIELTVDNKMAKVNDEYIELEVPATMVTIMTEDKSVYKVINGVATFVVEPGKPATRLVVPLRFIAENLGVDVGWDDRTRTVALSDLTKVSNDDIILAGGTKKERKPLFVLAEGKYNIKPVFYYNGKKAVFSGVQPFGIRPKDNYIGDYHIWYPLKGVLDALCVGYTESDKGVKFSFKGDTYEVMYDDSWMIRQSDNKRIFVDTIVEEGEICVVDWGFFREFFISISKLKVPKEYYKLSSIGINYVIDENCNSDSAANYTLLRGMFDHIPLDIFRQIPISFKMSSYEEDVLRTKVSEIVSGKLSDYERVKAIAYWVADNCYYGNYVYDKSRSYPYNVYMDRVGVCGDLAILNNTMCQLAGYPARCVLVFSGNQLHSINEVYVDGKWIVTDIPLLTKNTYTKSSGKFNYNGVGDVGFDLQFNWLEPLTYSYIDCEW